MKSKCLKVSEQTHKKIMMNKFALDYESADDCISQIFDKCDELENTRKEHVAEIRELKKKIADLEFSYEEEMCRQQEE